MIEYRLVGLIEAAEAPDVTKKDGPKLPRTHDVTEGVLLHLSKWAAVYVWWRLAYSRKSQGLG